MKSTIKTCSCNSPQCPGTKQQSKVKKTIRTIPSLFLSFIVAFFPKCPMCWAIYMSMLGSFGIVKVPYMGWLFPVFLCFSAFYLWMLLRKADEKGFGPFLISLIGFAIILSGRFFFPNNEVFAISGIGCIISGSLWNSLTVSVYQRLYG